MRCSAVKLSASGTNEMRLGTGIILAMLTEEMQFGTVVPASDLALLMLGGAIGFATDGTGCFFLIQGQHAALDIF